MMRFPRPFRQLAALLVGGFVAASSGFAHYYYTYFNSTSAPYTPIVARFDLSTLTNNTVPFFVSSATPSMYAGDSMTAIASQITAAANVWNGVNTSQIRLAYGGFYNPAATQSAPGIQIEFSDDIPPGLLALSIPTVVGDFATAPDGSVFLPIYLSIMQLPSDLADYFDGPSYSEQFFVTVVHEFGHTLGLQHTLTSSVMSTLNTSASSKASPLGADDIAGVSLLYPTSKYLKSVGSISGTVTLNGNGVNLASVVAISPSNPAIAALTNPDGTYRIDGVPPGVYYVYVHPLPQPVEGESSPDNVWLPKDSSGNYLSPQIGFTTQFYPGTQDYTQAATITVKAAKVNSGIDFAVNPVSSPGIGSVRTYSYTQKTYVVGAPVLLGGKTTIAATGNGLLEPNNSNNVLTPGLSVGALGTAAQITNLRAFPPGNPYIAVDATPALTASAGPVHMLFSTPGDLYVLPAGFSLVAAPPPIISALGPSVDQNGNPAVAISGEQFTSATQVWFDGLPATIQSQTSNILIVTPPSAPSGYTAAVVALNGDGQSSLFLNSTASTYSYASGPLFAAAANPSIVVSPSTIPAGGSITVDVQGANTNFVQGLTSVGFGTSDVTVNQVTVIDPTHLSVNVTPNVSIGSANITITTGLEAISQALGSPITATDPQQ